MRMVVLALVGALLFAAACGDDEDTGNGNNDADGGTTPVATSEETPSGGDGGVPTVTGEATTTDSGLQIIDVEEGDGAEVAAGATVTVHYTGYLEDGTVFDSSVERGTHATFPLGNLIPAWQEGIPGMKEGGKRRLIVPPELGYGAAGSPPDIPPNATLIFDIELISVG